MNEDQINRVRRYKKIFDIEQQIWEIHSENQKYLRKYVFVNWLHNNENYVISLKYQYLLRKVEINHLRISRLIKIQNHENTEEIDNEIFEAKKSLSSVIC